MWVRSFGDNVSLRCEKIELRLWNREFMKKLKEQVFVRGWRMKSGLC